MKVDVRALASKNIFHISLFSTIHFFFLQNITMFNKFGENYSIRNKLSFSLFFFLFKHSLSSKKKKKDKNFNWMYKKLKMYKVYFKSE